MREIKSRIGFEAQVLLRMMDWCGYLTRPFNYRGYYMLNKWLGRLIQPDTTVQIRLTADSLYEIMACDPYWNRLIHDGFRYEPEIFYFFELLKGNSYAFVDGGANWGYWSVLASSAVYGAVETVAYEPMPHAFSILSQNSAVNDNRFNIVNKAIAGMNVNKVSMVSTARAQLSAVGASISTDIDRMDTAILVDAVDIDQVLRDLHSSVPTVIKLDLEGVEAAVIESSTWINEHDCALVFEDHGKDPNNEATAAIMARNWPVYYYHTDGRLELVESLNRVAALKTVSHRGYNFFGAHPGGIFDQLLAANVDRRQNKDRVKKK